MKVRNGFVSNSSSSSFIIASKDKDPKITISSSIRGLCDKAVKTLKELDEHFKDAVWKYEIYDNEYGKVTFEDLASDDERYQDAVEAIKAGNTIYFCTASSEDGDGLSLAIHYGEDFEVINGEVLYHEGS